MAKQKAQYLVAFPEKDPEAAKAADAEGKVNAAATEAAKAPGAKKATAKM